jgi:hypothetical protein
MKKVEMPSIPDDSKRNAIRRNQYAEIGSGGADLIKVDITPEWMNFQDILEFSTSYTINGQQTPLFSPLLENEDGIIYYQDADNVSYLY